MNARTYVLLVRGTELCQDIQRSAITIQPSHKSSPLIHHAQQSINNLPVTLCCSSAIASTCPTDLCATSPAASRSLRNAASSARSNPISYDAIINN